MLTDLMTILASVESSFPVINKAAGDFLGKLTGTDITKDIALSAGMAGLMLLRSHPASCREAAPGTVILGAIPDDAYQTLSHFVCDFALSNGLNPKDVECESIPPSAKDYLPELTQFEQPFYEVCKMNSIHRDLFPFVAAAAAGKLVLAGNQLRLLNPRIGLAILFFHIAAGSKTCPHPPPSLSQEKPE
jgi:hypothetical protein